MRWKIFAPLLLLFSIFSVNNAYIITKSPEDSIWSKDGDEVVLTCEVAEPWQWCYWEVTRTYDQVTFENGKLNSYVAETMLDSKRVVEFVLQLAYQEVRRLDNLVSESDGLSEGLVLVLGTNPRLILELD